MQLHKNIVVQVQWSYLSLESTTSESFQTFVQAEGCRLAAIKITSPKLRTCRHFPESLVSVVNTELPLELRRQERHPQWHESDYD